MSRPLPLSDAARDELTERQREVLQYIRRFGVDRLTPPSYRDLCEHFGWSSVNAATNHLEALERKGFIERGQGRVRAIAVTAKALPTPGIPVVDLAKVDEA